MEKFQCIIQANKKTRNRAYEIIVQIGHACVDEDKGGNKQNLFNFFNMVENQPETFLIALIIEKRFSYWLLNLL